MENTDVGSFLMDIIQLKDTFIRRLLRENVHQHAPLIDMLNRLR